MTTKYRMPTEVSYLTAKHIHCGAMNGEQDDGVPGTHCLLGWAATDFSGVLNKWGDIRDDHPAVQAIYKRLGEHQRNNPASDIIHFNDEIAGEAQKAKIARVYNLAMADLGYTEPA